MQGHRIGSGNQGGGCACVTVVGAMLAGLLSATPTLRGQHAEAVLRYEPGVGFATEFGTGAGYTNTAAILGEPSRVTPGAFGGPVDPFSPPYLREQVLSLGAGGVVELRLDSPALRSPLNPHGLDFIVFGASGFIIVNGDYSGGGITDGSLFGVDPSLTRVSVSSDGVQYFMLDGSLAPAVEAMFPTDGSGDFRVPVDPALTLADFAGLGLPGIRALYSGSGGGVGYSLAWARDGAGVPVELASAEYIRIEVLSGRVEIDGIATVRPVPEPEAWALAWAGALGLGAFSWRRGGVR